MQLGGSARLSEKRAQWWSTEDTNDRRGFETAVAATSSHHKVALEVTVLRYLPRCWPAAFGTAVAASAERGAGR